MLGYFILHHLQLVKRSSEHLVYNLYEYNSDTPMRGMGTGPLYSNTYGDSTLATDMGGLLHFDTGPGRSWVVWTSL